MKIPEQYYEKYPKLENTFIKITSSLQAMEECRVEQVYPNEEGKHLMPLITFRFYVYLQVVLNRILELSQSLITCFTTNNLASSFILLRALDENISSIYDVRIRIINALEANDFQTLHEIILNLQYATRSKKTLRLIIDDYKKEGDPYYTEEKVREIYSSKNILTIMDRVSKTIPDHREVYEYLCEYAHPNYDGLEGLYCDWVNEFTVNISKNSSLLDRNIKNLFNYFRTFLEMFISSYDIILKAIPLISQLAIESMKSKGEDTSSYEK